MNEVKRGAPPKDGEWYVISTGGADQLVRYDSGHFITPGGGWYEPHSILAHRKHEPLVVPPLKELHQTPFTPCVVSLNGSDPCMAKRWPTGGYDIDSAHTGYPNYYKFGVRELTKAECEAAGYRWPF